MAKESKPAVTQKTTSPADFKTDDKENRDLKQAEEQAAGIKRQDTQAPKSAPDVAPESKSKPDDAPSEGKEGSGKRESGAPPPGSPLVIPGDGSMTVMIEGRAEVIERGKAFTPSAAVRELLEKHRIPIERPKAEDTK